MNKISKFILIVLLANLVKGENYKSAGKTCGDIEVKYDAQKLNQLEGCQIIEGNLKILWVSGADRISFPPLMEITGYLMITGTTGISSVSQLFPNLTAIRGDQLFSNYAMVLYDNPDLENIGLGKLRKIDKGSVRIQRNPKLCFVETVDWGKIITGGADGKLMVQDNVKPDNCPKCPTATPNCWAPDIPQSTCNGTCCDSTCLSCQGDDSNTCTSCKHFIAGSFQDHVKCVETCPYKQNEFMNYRCITTQECINLNLNKVSEPRFIPFRGVCKEGCPEGYEVKNAIQGNSMSATCTKCVGKSCWRKCKATIIEDVSTARTFKGCQVIDGPLEIRIKSGVNVNQELEFSLSDVVEIEDYLKIVHSHQIKSLDFLKSLRTIRGSKLDSNKHAVTVFDNEHLENLFSDDRELEISNGKILFSFNPKLCYDKITNLVQHDANRIDNVVNTKLNNGDRALCNVTKINVRTEKIYARGVLVKWEPLKLVEAGKDVNYVIFYTESGKESGQSSCGSDDWDAEDISDFNPNATITHPMTRLKPFTRYAFYVKAYSLSTDRTGAQSDVNYFTTMPGKPDKVFSLKAKAKSDSEIHITWQPPTNPNSQLTTYIIAITPLPGIKDFSKTRDFCKNPLDTAELKREADEQFAEYLTHSSSSDDGSRDFEDEIQGLRRDRYRRSIDESCPDSNQLVINATADFVHVPADKTEFVVDGLRHYSYYTISIRACHEENSASDNEEIEEACGDEVEVQVRTAKSKLADVIEDFEVNLATNSSDKNVKVSWIPPKNPNGKIISYQIIFKDVSREKSEESTSCISLADRDNACSSSIDYLKPGNYSFKLAATSLAGQGPLTTTKFLYIEAPSHLSLIASPAFMTLLFFIIASVIGVGVYKLYEKSRGSTVEHRFEEMDGDRLMS